MKFEINPVTNRPEAKFSAKLITLSAKTLENSKGTNYKVATIEFVDDDGVLQRTSGFVFEGNYSKGMKIGETYLATAAIMDNGQDALIQVSHLIANGERATAAMFGYNTVAETIVSEAKEAF